MAVKTFTADADWVVGLEAQCDVGYRTVAYTGSLGGGTLRIWTQVADGGGLTPVADSKLSAGTVDGNGDVVQQLTFQSSGSITVKLTGSTNPNAVVSVQ
ncbi:hypothetical protein [Rhizobium sp. 12,4]|uniref:hypothetical protein n=1 Tax=Rhizobium sp. 12,4 TaxID=3405135 RepID=UPI003D332E4F